VIARAAPSAKIEPKRDDIAVKRAGEPAHLLWKESQPAKKAA